MKQEYAESKQEYSDFLRERVTALCREKHITLKKFASDMGIGRTSLFQYFTGKTDPKTDIVYRFAKYFGVSVDYLLGLTDEKEGKDANDLGLSPKALETLASIINPDRQPSAFDSIGKLFSCMYAPAYPDWDGDWDEYSQKFSEIYGVDNEDLLNKILSQDVWDDVAEDMNRYFTFCIFEQQILLTRKRLETWVQEYARTDPEAAERAIEKITDLEQQAKQIREYSQFLHFKLLQTVEQAFKECTKEVAEEKKAANKMNANFVLQSILVKPPVEVPESE